MARFTQCEQKSRSVLSTPIPTPITTPNKWQKTVMDQARSPEVDQYLERQDDPGPTFCRRNQDVYEKISSELSETGFSRTYQQCCEKLKKLKCEYKRIKDKRNKTGEGRYPEWDYFDAIDAVLRHRPATEPAVVIDTL